MPIIPAIGAGLAALGGGSALAGAAIATSAIGGVVSAVGAGKTAAAAEHAGDLNYQASQDAIASNDRIAAQIRADNEPARQIGGASLSALGSAFGLPGYSGASMTGSGPAANYGAPAGGVSMTGGSAPASGGADWSAYLAANPDVAAWAASGHGDPALGPDQTPEQAAAYQYRNTGQAEGRPLPTVSMTGGAPVAAAAADGGTPAGYTDPTAPGGYSPGARPDPGPAPSPYVAQARMTGPALDVSGAAYEKSPGFEFQMEQGQRGLDHVAAAGGGIMSGARQKAALRFSQGLAQQDYQDWRNFTAGQFNIDRSRGDAIYSEDRGFGYGQARDARGDYVTDRSRGDGLFQDDRAFTTGRYDTRNQQLLTLAGFGTNANASNANTATSFAANNNAATMTAANAKADAGVNAANAGAQWSNGLMTTGSYLLGRTLKP